MSEFLSDNIERKFTDSVDIKDYEVETDTGFVDIKALHVTIPYLQYYIETESGKSLVCADDHILFDGDMAERFAKDFSVGDKLHTIDGVENVVKVKNLGEESEMYDLELCDNSNHRYYTNGILSHNTLISKKLAENIFGSEDYLVRFDMSEYQDKTSVNKLIGSSAGYVGYENGGLLTEAIKNKPYCVLLFDEIEKADESIYNLFLQLFDEGRLTDNNGTTVNFKNVIVIMTSNVGVKQANERGGGIGFTVNAEANKRSIIEKNLKSKFSPEFLNRIDKIIHFNPLTDENLKVIVDIELKKLCNRVKENDINLEYDPNVIDFVYKEAIEQKEYGARPIMRIIQDEVSDKVVDLILTSNKHENSYYVKVGEDGNVEASVVKK